MIVDSLLQFVTNCYRWASMGRPMGVSACGKRRASFCSGVRCVSVRTASEFDPRGSKFSTGLKNVFDLKDFSIHLNGFSPIL